MDENTRNIVASNLTIAYLSASPQQVARIDNEGPVMRRIMPEPETVVFTIFKKFYDLLGEQNNQQ